MPEKTVRAVSNAFVQMQTDPRGKAVLEAASKLVALPTDTRFIASDGSEYGAYRDFYRTAPASLR